MNTLKFDMKCKCGPEFVCVRILENCDDLKVGNIWLPTNAQANGRLAHCIIEDIGWKAAENHGLKVGDYVLIDRLATFAHTTPVAVLKYDSVIVKTNKDNSEHYPMRNMVFVEPEKKVGATNNGGIFVLNDADKMNLGTVLAINADPELKVDFKVGDKVLLAKGGDIVQLGEKTLNIYKPDQIICSLPKED